MTDKRGKVAVVGGSMAGLCAGLLLARYGWDVQIFERSGEELASRGAGITPHQELFDAFRHAGVDLEGAMGVEAHGRTVLARDGTISASIETPQLFTSWGLLYRFLRRKFPNDRYHNGISVRHIEQHERGVIVGLDDGSEVATDWLIGADGLRSVVRDHVAPQAQLNYTGYVAWRGLVPEALLAGTDAEQLEQRMTFYLPPGEHILGYTVAGPHDTLTPGQRWYNWVWYRPTPAGAAYTTIFTDAEGEFHAEGIPPHRIRAAVTAAMRHDAQRLLPPQFRAVVNNTDQPFLQPIVELANERLVFGRIVLIGDAAFTARPHIGLGVSKAADDAATLVRAFARPSRELPGALGEWEQSRLRFGRAVLKRSADLGCYLNGAPGTPSDAARFEHFRQPAVVMAGIAAAEPYQFLDL